MEGTIVLSRKEARRAAVLEEVAGESITLREAAKLPAMSYRHARRVNRRYQCEGLSGLANRARGRPAGNVVASDVRTRILELLRLAGRPPQAQTRHHGPV